MVAGALSLLLTPAVRWLAIRMNFLALPVSRSVHKSPVPYMGGVAIYLAFVLTSVMYWDLSDSSLQGLLLAGGFMVLVGVVDDLMNLPPAVKLMGQVAAVIILVLYGISIEKVTHPWGGFIHFGYWSIPVTMLWVLAFTNALNFIDGLDGLAAGVALIASLTFLNVALQTGQPLLAVYICAVLGGAALGFLPYNFHPAKIFMGDAGSMFLGFMLASISIVGTLKSTAAIALGIPILVLGLPVMDTVWAIFRRLSNGQAVYQADRNHFHHRLLKMGMSHREAVLVMYCVSGWMGISALALTNMHPASGFGIMTFAFVSVYFGAKKFGIMDEERG